MFGQVVDGLLEGPLRFEAGELLKLLCVRSALGDLREVFAIGLVEGNELNLRRAVGALDHHSGQLKDTGLAGVADVDDCATGSVVQPVFKVRQQVDGTHRVADVAEGADLGAVTKHCERVAGEGLLNEAWDDKAIGAGLMWPDHIEEAWDDHMQSVFAMVGLRLDFIGELAQCVAV